tara:strand:+ start:695 stop:1015 length:321 start_codon:yes stop_codon:yes gene_type:complete
MIIRFTKKVPLVTDGKVVAIQVEATGHEGGYESGNEVLFPAYKVSAQSEYTVPEGDQKPLAEWTESEINAICDSVSTSNNWSEVLESKINTWVSNLNTKIPAQFSF